MQMEFKIISSETGEIQYKGRAEDNCSIQD
jgi:hypothetical protein